MTTPRRLLAAAVMTGVALVATSARAHDQWLEPETHGPIASVRLFVGEAPSRDDEKVFERAKFARLALTSRNGTLDLLATGVEGAKPIVSVPGLGDGEYLVTAERAPVLIELEAAKFEAYLTEEGLGRIVRERAQRGETASRGRERYTRFMKALFYTSPDDGRAGPRHVRGSRGGPRRPPSRAYAPVRRGGRSVQGGRLGELLGVIHDDALNTRGCTLRCAPSWDAPACQHCVRAPRGLPAGRA